MSRGLSIILGGILFGCLWGGIYTLFQLQRDQGSQYPVYSTFRNDPLGAKILYESLRRWSAGSAGRILNRTWEKPSGKNGVWILLGVDATKMLFDQRSKLEVSEFLQEGGRLVIALRSEGFKNDLNSMAVNPSGGDRSSPDELREDAEIKKESIKTATPEEVGDPVQKEANERRTKKEKREKELDDYLAKNFWNLERELGFCVAPFALGEKKSRSLKETKVDKNLRNKQEVGGDHSVRQEQGVEWNSSHYFALGDPAWKICDTLENRPVWVERDFHGGTIVLLSDSKWAMNQSIQDRIPVRLILSVFGGNKKYWFDETHLKVVRHVSLMQLIRRSGGLGALVGFGLLWGLWVWKNQSSLAPAVEIDRRGESQGHGSLQNLSAHFESHLRGDRVWDEMIGVWARSAEGKGKEENVVRARSYVQSILRGTLKLRDHEIEREISKILNERK